VHAWIFEREHRWGLNTALARYLGLNLKKLSPAARLRFNQRTALFHAESEEGKVIDIACRRQPHPHHDAAFGQGRPLQPARGDRCAAHAAAASQESRAVGAVPWRHRPGRTAAPLRGQAQIVPAQGVSIISDIDDTIKRTQVRDRREMLLNTFSRRFEAAPAWRLVPRIGEGARHALSLPVGQPDAAVSAALGFHSQRRLSRGQHAPAREHHVAHADPRRRRFARAQARRDRAAAGRISAAPLRAGGRLGRGRSRNLCAGCARTRAASTPS
jgi:hypothetical protein